MPTVTQWQQFVDSHPKGSTVSGIVRSVHRFGAFFDVETDAPVTGLLEIIYAPRDSAPLAPGDRIERADVLFFRPFPNPQVYVSLLPDHLGDVDRTSAS